MVTVGTGNGAIFGANIGGSRATSLGASSRFITEVFDGADEALAALEAVESGLVSTGFQTLDWLTVLYEELAPSYDAMPRLVVVTERGGGNVALVLPLVVTREGKLRVASFADLGVSDYGGPIIGPGILQDHRSIRRAWRSIRRAMPDIDLIRLQWMPAEIGGHANPLLTRFGIASARHFGNRLTVTDTVEGYIRALGKKYRKEVERCYQLWQQAGTPHFYRAATAEEIAHVCSALEEQQARRHAALHREYVLDEPQYRSFYERLAIDGSEAGLAAVFALEANGEIIATLFGIVHDGTFTLLRISMGGERCGRLSPGRLIVIEAMKYFVARGVKRFDMGVGDYAFNRGFGSEQVPLYDLVVAKDVTALPKVLVHRLKGHLRRNGHARPLSERPKPDIGR